MNERLSKPCWMIYKNIFFFSNTSNKCLFLVMVERLDFEFFAYHFARVWEPRHVLIIWNPRELSHLNLKAMLWLVRFWEWHAQLCSAGVCGEGEWDRHKKRLQGGYCIQVISMNGTHSNPKPFVAGVSQGYVLGSVLFVFYINDITDNTSSHMRLFTDDSVTYREISIQEDQLPLQQDLDNLCKWQSLATELSYH